MLFKKNLSLFLCVSVVVSLVVIPVFCGCFSPLFSCVCVSRLVLLFRLTAVFCVFASSSLCFFSVYSV